MSVPLVAAAAVLGLLLGSFANVVIHRVPDGEGIGGRSRCPACGAAIAAHDNVPVVSWLWLRGRCRACRARIPARYPFVELASAVLLAAVAWRVGASWLLPAYLAMTWALLVLAVIDLRTRRIPNAITYPLAPALLVLAVGGALLEGDPAAALRSPLAGLAAFAVLLAVALISPRGMGMGDVKLAGVIGIGVGPAGWGHVVVAVFGGFLLGGVVAIALLLLRWAGRRDQIPFGPYLAVGAVASLFVGEAVVEGYLRSAGLA